ncbi:MAG: YaaR family protein [Spirochaetota bacterium]
MAAKLHNLDQNWPSTGLLRVREQRKKKRAESVRSAQFSQLLLEEEAVLGAENRQEILKDYLERITQAGWNLQKAPTRSALREYRRLIQGFLEQTLKGLYQIKEDLGRLNYSSGQRKKYALIQVVDEKLAELVQTVLSEQQANLTILQRIEEINGLLINLLS